LQLLFYDRLVSFVKNVLQIVNNTKGIIASESSFVTSLKKLKFSAKVAAEKMVIYITFH